MTTGPHHHPDVTGQPGPPDRDEVLARLTARGARFEIVTEDVLGQRLQVFAHRHRSLVELLEASRAFGDRDYVVTEHERIGFLEHYGTVAALAAALREEYGIGPGQRVAICAANSPQWVLTFWAVVSLGGVVVGMNSLWARDEIRYGLDLTTPALLVADGPRREVAGETAVATVALEGLAELIAPYVGAELPQVTIAEDDPAVVLFTSGTSGRPKGSVHSHRNVLSAVWFHLLNDAVAAELGFAPQDRRFLLATPLFHIAALHNLAVVRLAVGDTAVIHQGRFDIDEVLRLIEAQRVTNWGAVPTMVSRLVERAEQRGLDDLDLSSLRTISINSAPSSPRLKERVRAALPTAGRSLGTTYGMTECSTAATLALAGELATDPDTVGRPVPTMEVEIRDEAGDPVASNVEGEIHLRGPQVQLGYWNDPDATAASLTPDGWFRTGDLGALTVAGHLRIASRRSDLILRGGENVYPAEVEHQLLLHPAVRECIVLGVPDPDLGEVVGAVVVLETDAMADAAIDERALIERALIEHLRPRLARYKIPTAWALGTTPLPRNATGKVIRRQVSLPPANRRTYRA